MATSHGLLKPAHAERIRVATIDHPHTRRSKLVFGIHDELAARRAKRRLSAPLGLSPGGGVAAMSATTTLEIDPLMPRQGTSGHTHTHHTTPMAEMQRGHTDEAVEAMERLVEEDMAEHERTPGISAVRADSSAAAYEEHLHLGKDPNRAPEEVLKEHEQHGRPTVILHRLENAPESQIHSDMHHRLDDVAHSHRRKVSQPKLVRNRRRGRDHSHSDVASPIKVDPWIAELVRQQNIRDHGVYHHIAVLASSAPFQIGTAVILWLVVGTVFYHFSSGFRIPQAFFFTIQAGLSVGYGADGVTCYDADDQAACNYFTTAQVVLTSALISVMLSVYLDALICNSFNEWEEIKREVLHRYRDNNDSYVHEKKAERDQSDIARTVPRRLHSIDRPCYPEHPQSGAADPTELRAFELLQKPWKALVRGSREPYIRMLMIVVVFIAIGAAWAFYAAEMNFSESLLFSVTSLSTGGLTQPDAEKDGVALFIAFFCLFGIPMYAGLLGAIAGYMTTRRNRSLLRDRLHSSISNTDIMCMSALHGHHDDHFDYADYLSLQLIKLGAVSPATIGKIQAHFIEMDDNDSGTLSRDQLLVEHAFDSVDTSKLGVIDRKEFAQLCTYLARCGNSTFERIVSSKEMFEDEFGFLVSQSQKRQRSSEHTLTSHAPDIRIKSSDAYITRQVFCQWWITVKQVARRRDYAIDVLTDGLGLDSKATVRRGSRLQQPIGPGHDNELAARLQTLDLADSRVDAAVGSDRRTDDRVISAPPVLRVTGSDYNIDPTAGTALPPLDEATAKTPVGMLPCTPPARLAVMGMAGRDNPVASQEARRAVSGRRSPLDDASGLSSEYQSTNNSDNSDSEDRRWSPTPPQHAESPLERTRRLSAAIQASKDIILGGSAPPTVARASAPLMSPSLESAPSSSPDRGLHRVASWHGALPPSSTSPSHRRSAAMVRGSLKLGPLDLAGDEERHKGGTPSTHDSEAIEEDSDEETPPSASVAEVNV
mmetsp:Transcript_7604/g.19620  ORF Transcript_7604/g.19620 Transcript_7604/m.19620 type:complete len:994 (+) Transcript_7604:281-3262(+)